MPAWTVCDHCGAVIADPDKHAGCTGPNIEES